MNSTHEAALALAAMQNPILRLATRYLKEHGFTLPRDGFKAKDWCEEQAKRGLADAQMTNGVLLSLGLFGEADPHAARFWLQSAADQEHPAALLMLSGFIEEGWDSEPPNVPLALSLIQRALDKQYPPAMVQMAVLHLSGVHVEEDRDRAVDYLRSAAALDDPAGQCLLGATLLDGDDPAELEEGLRWLEIAAENDHGAAHRFLADLFAWGDKGLPRDKKRSERHSLIAKKIENLALADFR